MPTYTFREKNGKEFEKIMGISEMEEWRKINPEIEMVMPSTLNIISGRSMSSNKDGGFNEVLHKVSEAHPNSALADDTLRKSNKQVKTQALVKKHFR
jgi:hypothetical protein